MSDATRPCPHCRNGYFDGSETECINGVLIDVDVAHEGWQRDVAYPPSPCQACSRCRGTGVHGNADCQACGGTGWLSGRDESQERLAAWAQEFSDGE